MKRIRKSGRTVTAVLRRNIVSDNKKNSPEKEVVKEKLTLPWLIISIASMVSFLAFIIAMFFHFYPAIFFAVFILVIAAGIFLDGLHKKKENYISGNINFIMVILCVICALMLMKT